MINDTKKSKKVLNDLFIFENDAISMQTKNYNKSVKELNDSYDIWKKSNFRKYEDLFYPDIKIETKDYSNYRSCLIKCTAQKKLLRLEQAKFGCIQYILENT